MARRRSAGYETGKFYSLIEVSVVISMTPLEPLNPYAEVSRRDFKTLTDRMLLRSSPGGACSP